MFTSRSRWAARRFGVACSLTMVMTAVPAGLAAASMDERSSAASADDASVASEVTRTRAEQVRFRRSLGLDASGAAVDRAAAAGNDAELQFGVPLTDAELGELLRRDQVIQDDVQTVRTTVAESFGEDTFAGVWMDNLGGGVLTVAVTHSAAAVRDALAGVVEHPDDLRVVVRAHSLAELERIAGRLRTLSETAGRQLSGIRLDERGNTLRVLTTEDVDATRGWIATALGAGAPVDVEPAGVVPVGTQYNNSPPLRGGQAINSTGGYTCTSAFTARGPSALYVLTAGHCGKSGEFWEQVGTPVGIADKSDVTGTDVLRIPVNGSALTNEVTLWYTPALATEARYRTIKSSQASSADAVGQVSCITGQNFADLRCGEIVTRGFDVSTPTGDGRQITYSNGREIDADCNPGDSGGSALYGSQARGIVSIKVKRTLGNDTCVYVHIASAMSQIGVTDVLVDGVVIGV